MDILSSGISDDDDDEYLPLVPFSEETARYLAKLTSRTKKLELQHRRKISPFSCYFCPKRKFKDARAVHSHNKRNHKDTCRKYSFQKWKCRRCNRRLPSLNIRGLMAHVEENRCIIRRRDLTKNLRGESENMVIRSAQSPTPSSNVEAQTKFLANLQLIPSPSQFSGNKMNQPEGYLEKINPQSNEKTPVNSPSRHVHFEKKCSSHRALKKTNTNVQRNIDTINDDEMRKKLPKAKPKNLDAEVFCTSYLKTKRSSASKAYEKLCPKTLRRYKRQMKGTKKGKSTRVPVSVSEVHTTVDENNGRIVLRCEPSYWSKVKNGEIFHN